ncbi:MAG: NAD(+)/NADH kinase [Succinivibrionaceae bacterium]
MLPKISSVVLYSRVANESVVYTIYNLIDFLLTQSIKVYIESKTAKSLELSNLTRREHCSIVSFKELITKSTTPDLFIVIGGDGSMLGASREIHHLDIPVLGINKGHLGFLTDITPADCKTTLSEILNGNYLLESRFFLATRVLLNNKEVECSIAINEAVIQTAKTAHMIDFSIYINDIFMYSQKADGLIISTPTGSTAYNLSAGGPIIEPTLDLISLVPMFPHSMNCRPFITSAQNTIKVKFNNQDNVPEPISVACDGQVIMDATDRCEIKISKSPQKLTICHHPNYDYYKTLRSKLGFASKLVN